MADERKSSKPKLTQPTDVSASTPDASPMRNELLDKHAHEHPEGDPAVRRTGPILEPADGTANDPDRDLPPGEHPVKLRSDSDEVKDLGHGELDRDQDLLSDEHDKAKAG